jgi:hypothetical protein
MVKHMKRNGYPCYTKGNQYYYLVLFEGAVIVLTETPNQKVVTKSTKSEEELVELFLSKGFIAI